MLIENLLIAPAHAVSFLSHFCCKAGARLPSLSLSTASFFHRCSHRSAHSFLMALYAVAVAVTAADAVDNQIYGKADDTHSKLVMLKKPYGRNHYHHAGC